MLIDGFEYTTNAEVQAAWISSILSSTNTWSRSPANNWSGASNTNQRMIISAANISTSGNKIRVTFKANSGVNLVIAGASIGERDGVTGNFVSAPTRLKFNGNNGVTVLAGATQNSDVVNFSLDETKDYLVHLYLTTVGVVYGSGDGRYYILDSGVDNTTTVNISSAGYSSDGTVCVCITNIAVVDLDISVSSNSTGVESGSYNMKVVAPATTSLNKTITRTLVPTWNWTGQTEFKLRFKSSRTGSNIKIGFHDSGGTTTELTPNVLAANTFATYTLDISAVSDVNKDAIDSIIVTVLNADAENEMYFEFVQVDDGTSGTGGGGVSRSRIIGGV